MATSALRTASKASVRVPISSLICAASSLNIASPSDAGGSKNTPTNVKMTLEVVGSTGRLVVDNAGDGRDDDGNWTGVYRAT